MPAKKISIPYQNSPTTGLFKDDNLDLKRLASL